MWKRHTPIHSDTQHTLLSTSQLTIPLGVLLQIRLFRGFHQWPPMLDSPKEFFVLCVLFICHLQSMGLQRGGHD